MRPDEKFMAKMGFTRGMAKSERDSYNKYKNHDCVTYYHLSHNKRMAQMIIKTAKGFKGYARRRTSYWNGNHGEYDYTLYPKDVNDIIKETENWAATCKFTDEKLMPALYEWRVLQGI